MAAAPLPALAFACALALAPRPQDAPEPAPVPAPEPDPELVRALEELVDLPTQAERAARAAVLVRDARHDLEDWLVAMRAFGRFEPLEPGFSERRASLPVGDGHEETDLFMYVPARYDPRTPAPLLLSFHGTGGEGRQAAPMWRATAEELGMLVLAPSEAGANEGYAFTERERQAALAALRWVRRLANVDEDRVFVTGVSRGGHLAWDLALRHPDRFAALAPMIGGPRMALVEGQNNLRYVENVAHLPLRDLQGADDDPRLVANLELAFARLAAAGAADAELLLQPGYGHSFDFRAVDWTAFLGAARRDPHPRRVVRLTARAEEGRAAFVEALELDRDVAEEFQPEVQARRWNALDEDGQRRYLQELADARTARLEVRRAGPGEYEVDARGVRRWRLLIPAEEHDPGGKVVVRQGGKTLNRRPKASKQVLLEEFAERFDRRFLPVAALELR